MIYVTSLEAVKVSLQEIKKHTSNQSHRLVLDSIIKQVTKLNKSYTYRKKPMREFNRSLSPRLKIVAKLSKKTLSLIAHEHGLSQQILSQAVAGKSKSLRARTALEAAWKLQLEEIQAIYKQDLKSSPSATERETFHARYKKIIGAA